MTEKYFLSAADRETLKSVIDEVMGSRINTPSRSDQPTRLGAPETYLAFIPAGGIAAATDSGGTGTGTDETIGVPGSAECELYSITGYGSTASLVRTPGLTRLVYNPFPVAVTAGQFVVVTRTKGGSWVVTGNVEDVTGAMPGAVGPVHLVDTNGTTAGTGGWYAQRVERSGAGWIVSAGPVDYSVVVEINGLPPRYLDTNATPGATALAVTTLFRDVNGAYYVDYPFLSDSASDTFNTVLTWSAVCNADGSFTISPATYQTVTITSAWDNWSDFPRVNVRLTVS